MVITDATQEKAFQHDILKQMLSNGWLLGESSKHNKALGLFPDDVIAFVKSTQPEQ